MRKFHIRTIQTLVGVLLAGFIMISCDDDDDPVDDMEMGASESNIVELASATDDLTILVSALTKFPDLVNVLSGEGSFTVFAPNNQAFTNLLGVIDQDDLDDIPENVLRRVLEYHVISGASLASTSLSNGQTAATVLGDEITVVTTESSVSINTSRVLTADVEATNGIVHIIDAVLVPTLEASIVGTVVAPAYFNTDFTTLTAAVIKANLLNTLIDKNKQYTVFAPNDAAFAAAGITSLDGFTEDDLQVLLFYHTINSEVKSADLPETGSAINSLVGAFYLSINDDGTFLNVDSEIIATDIDVDNGVVHVINKTLTRPTWDVVTLAIQASSDTENPEFTQLVAALTAVENDASTDALVTILSDIDGGPFTVFAPTDAAFAQLYDDAGVVDLDGLINAVGIGTLEAVLKYHVVGIQVLSSDLPNVSGNVTSLGGNFTVDVANSTIIETDAALMLNDNNVANITATDILGVNGVIHTIDKVILP